MKNYAYSVRRFSASPVAYWRSGTRGVVESPSNAVSRKNTLNHKCAPQDNRPITPPQEQGIRGQKCSSTKAIYPVKSIMSHNDSTSPYQRVGADRSNPQAKSSLHGISHTRLSASAGVRFWLWSWPLNSGSSSSLLSAA